MFLSAMGIGGGYGEFGEGGGGRKKRRVPVARMNGKQKRQDTFVRRRGWGGWFGGDGGWVEGVGGWRMDRHTKKNADGSVRGRGGRRRKRGF